MHLIISQCNRVVQLVVAVLIHVLFFTCFSKALRNRGKIVSINEYTIIKSIGKGAFAEVKLAVLDDLK